MKPRFRSLSCFLAVTALALVSTAATARTDATPPGKKTHAANKTPQAKEARPQRRAAVERRRHAKRAARVTGRLTRRRLSNCRIAATPPVELAAELGYLVFGEGPDAGLICPTRKRNRRAGPATK